jgi:hypothetical protein
MTIGVTVPFSGFWREQMIIKYFSRGDTQTVTAVTGGLVCPFNPVGWFKAADH